LAALPTARPSAAISGPTSSRHSRLARDVAVLSAEAAPAVIRDGGVIAYLTKPLDLTELGELLDAVAASLNKVGAAAPTPTL